MRSAHGTVSAIARLPLRPAPVEAPGSEPNQISSGTGGWRFPARTQDNTSFRWRRARVANARK